MRLFVIQFYFFLLNNSPDIDVKKPLLGALFKFRGDCDILRGDRDLLRANFGLFANAGGDARGTGEGLIFFVPFGLENLFGFLGAVLCGKPLKVSLIIASTSLLLCVDNN